MRARALACVLLSVVLVGTACGARLTTAQRNAGIGELVSDQGNNSAAGPQTSGSAPMGSGPIASNGPITGPLATGSAAASLPPGGNGGATALGVTATTITLSTASDVSGVQPGIFKSSWQAMQALAQYVNSTGGIYGRQIKNLLLDSKADSVANRAAVTQACDQSFALVGSMSAFEIGRASCRERVYDDV